MTNMPWEAILSRLDKLGFVLSDKAQKGVEFLWPLAYRQAVVGGISCAFWGLLMVLLGVIVPWKAIKRFSSADYSACDEEPFWIAAMIVAAIIGIIGVFLFASGLETLANPGWQAIDNLAGLLKPPAQ
jgi:hypothetical protein